MSALLACLFIMGLSSPAVSTDKFQPEQIHLSYGDDPTHMVVTWSTAEPVGSSVLYGEGSLEHNNSGSARKFVDGGVLHRTQYIHQVVMSNLKPAHKYMYQVGSEEGWSSVFWFSAMPSGQDWSPRLAVFGDMGSVNAQSLPRLQRETQMGMYDAVLHVGDLAYDMDWNNAELGDEFMRQIEPVAAYLPYMTCPGNHEEKYNFSNYKHRFNMPGDVDNMFYSFNMGPVHFVSISSEYYYFLNYGLKMAARQYAWLLQDLKEANSVESRAVRPWIVLFGHRPMYCSNANRDDCTRMYDALRTGLPVLHTYGVEELLWRFGVDVAVWAHEHSYERLWPVYNYTVYNGTRAEPYKNPGAPVHITTGSAGCQEKHDDFVVGRPWWSAFRSMDYGYTRMTFHNSTHMYMEQVSDDQDGEVIDRQWIEKQVHKPFGQLTHTQHGYL